jgi:hypothetical protein
MALALLFGAIDEQGGVDRHYARNALSTVHEYIQSFSS